jgi:hypothetical protein
MKNKTRVAANPIREPGEPQISKLPRRIAAIISFLLIALPLCAQFTTQDVTPAGTSNAGLSGTANGKAAGSHNGHAMVYDRVLNQTTDLANPVGAVNSVAKATDGAEEVGYSVVGYYSQCIVWNGSTGPAPVTLTPSTYLASWCLGTDGGNEIGWAWKANYIYSTEHAMMWSGNPNSSVDLHAGGAVYSRGRGVNGNEQVGEIDNSPTTDPDDGVISSARQAVLWHGTAASMVNLNPAGYLASAALATNGTQEGGWAAPSLATGIHAMMWSGSAATAVDLQPAGFTDTRVTALSLTMQVGDGWVGGAAHSLTAHRHALAWTGTAASALDLNQYIPVGYTDAVATGIDAAGNVVGYAFKTPTSGDHTPIDAIAVVFTAAPPPAWAISSLTLTPAFANTGDTLTGLVTLATPAPVGGATVNFFSANPSLIPPPADLLVLEGQSTASFVTSSLVSPITVTTPVTVVGATGSARKLATVTFLPIAKLSALTVSSPEGGTQAYGTITLNIPVPVALSVTLSTDNPALTIPPAVSFAVGQTSQKFLMTAAIVSALTPGTVTASLNGSVLSTPVNVTASVPVVLSSITLPPAVGGTTYSGTVTLNHAAYVGGTTVSLATSDPVLGPVPATITIPYGSNSGTFSGIAGNVTSQGTATITASLDAVSLSGTLTVTSLGVSSVTIPAALGGQSFTGTVTLNHTAPVGGIAVSLATSDSTLAPVPATLTIPAGAVWATFTGIAGTATSSGTATISASFNGASKSALLTVTVLGVQTVTIPGTFGGGSFTGTVTISNPAPLGGLTVSLGTSNATLAPVPATLTIPAGYISGTFTGIAGTATSQGTATITATLNGTSGSGIITVVSGPGATIQSLDYWTVSQLIKVTATTTMATGTLSFGLNANGPALGILTVEATTGLYQGSAKMSKAPSTIWVWNSVGGTAVSSSAVRLRSK